MAKNKRPFSSFLENPDTNKAVQEALHAPAQLPGQEPVPEPPVAEPAPQPTDGGKNTPTETGRSETGKKEKDEEGYQVITIRRSVHRLLKMASVHYGVEIREIASEALAADPRVQNMVALLEKNKL